MKIIKRQNTFETNSSSMHSIVLSKLKEDYTENEIMESFRGYCKWSDFNKGKLNVKFLNNDYNNDLAFGRAPFDVLGSYCDKLRYYIASMSYKWVDDDYLEFIEKLKEIHPFINSITFGKNGSYPNYSDNKYDYGYVDHQSSSILSRFLMERSLDIETFLKSKKYVIIVDGDEYNTTGHLLNAGILDLEEKPFDEGFTYVE